MTTKICLDAGHYGKRNQSPVVKEYWESEMTWKLFLRLKNKLEKVGFDVVGTREDQTKDLAVYDRGRTAKGCDLFISLHSNACDTESVDRVSTFYAFDNLNDGRSLAQKFADEIAGLMNVSYGKATTRESKENPGQEYYGVMRGARSVGCPLYFIIEHSFHTNKKAANWLLNDDNLEKLAELETNIICEYFNVENPDKPEEPVPEFKLLDMVSIKDGVTTWYNGKSMAKWVATSILYVRKINDDGTIVVSTLKEGAVTGTVWATDLEKVSEAGSKNESGEPSVDEHENIVDEPLFYEEPDETIDDEDEDKDDDVVEDESPVEEVEEKKEDGDSIFAKIIEFILFVLKKIFGKKEN